MKIIKKTITLIILFMCQKSYCNYFKVINYKEEKIVDNYKFNFDIDIPIYDSNKKEKFVQKVVTGYYKDRLHLFISINNEVQNKLAFKKYVQKTINFYLNKNSKYKGYEEELKKGIIDQIKFSEEYDNGVIYSFKVSKKYDKGNVHDIEGGTFNIRKKKEIFANELFGTDQENIWAAYPEIKEAIDGGYQKMAPKGSCKSLKESVAQSKHRDADTPLSLAYIDMPVAVAFIFTKNKELLFWGVKVREDTDKPWTCDSLEYEMAFPISYEDLKKIVVDKNPLTPYVD